MVYYTSIHNPPPAGNGRTGAIDRAQGRIDQTGAGRTRRNDMRLFIAKWLRIQIPIWAVVPMVGLVFLLGLGGGYLGTQWFENPYPCPQTAQVCANFQNFWKTWDLANQHFVDPKALQPDKMIDGAIEGMLDSLGDQGHTRYLSPEAARAEREALDGRFEGIGAYIDVRDDQPLIVQPIEDSPA